MLQIKDLQEFFDKSPGPHIGFKGICHDCHKPVTIKMDMDEEGKVTITDGALYLAQVGETPEDKKFFFKCDSCFKKDEVLRKYQPCEVYSRVVGYLRPVSQWNEGKQEEYKMRSKFSISGVKD